MPSRSLDDLLPEAREKCKTWLSLCEQKGIRVRITQTYRSQEEQNHLYEQGRTLPGRIVTWTRNSKHTSRRAWDFVVLNDDGTLNWDETAYKTPAELATICGCESGYYWRKQDCPHIQLFDKT